MTSKNVIFDPRKLEKLLIKDWIEFIDLRQLLNFIKNNVENTLNITNPKIQTLIISNCIFDKKGISLWISYKIIQTEEVVNATTEVFLNPDGTLENIRTI